MQTDIRIYADRNYLLILHDMTASLDHHWRPNLPVGNYEFGVIRHFGDLLLLHGKFIHNGAFFIFSLPLETVKMGVFVLVLVCSNRETPLGHESNKLCITIKW